jgi:hypothetical protein
LQVQPLLVEHNGNECVTPALGDDQGRMLKVFHRFGRYCICHFQGEFIIRTIIHTLKMATAVLAEMLENFRYSKQFLPKAAAVCKTPVAKS